MSTQDRKPNKNLLKLPENKEQKKVNPKLKK